MLKRDIFRGKEVRSHGVSKVGNVAEVALITDEMGAVSRTVPRTLIQALIFLDLPFASMYHSFFRLSHARYIITFLLFFIPRLSLI